MNLDPRFLKKQITSHIVQGFKIYRIEIFVLPCVRHALSAAPGAQDCLRVQFCVNTLGPPSGQSVLVHLGQQHAALNHWTLAETALSAHFIRSEIHVRQQSLLNSE